MVEVVIPQKNPTLYQGIFPKGYMSEIRFGI